MSTEIAKINRGKHLAPLILTQYYGGRNKGLCLYLNAEYKGFELNKSQVQQLVKELQNWLGEVELPFERIERRKKICKELDLTEDEAIDFGVLSDEIL